MRVSNDAGPHASALVTNKGVKRRGPFTHRSIASTEGVPMPPPYDWATDTTRPNPWIRPRRVAFTIWRLLLLVFLTLVIGYAVGSMRHNHPGARHTEGRQSMHIPLDKVALTNAQNYADWCGGWVDTRGNDIVVVACDR